MTVQRVFSYTMSSFFGAGPEMGNMEIQILISSEKCIVKTVTNKLREQVRTQLLHLTGITIITLDWHCSQILEEVLIRGRKCLNSNTYHTSPRLNHLHNRHCHHRKIHLVNMNRLHSPNGQDFHIQLLQVMAVAPLPLKQVFCNLYF